MDSRHISNLNDNNTISFNSDYLTPLILTPIAALTSSLNNQQTQSDIPDNSTIISLLLNHVLNPNEINLLLMGNNNNNNNNTNDDEAMESRNDLYQVSLFFL